MNTLFKISRGLYALTMGVFGAQHFIYATFVATLVPAWTPWHLFWAYFVGVALVAAAISIVINVAARQACLTLGLMIFVLVLLVDLPLLLNALHDGGKVTNLFKDIGLGCAAIFLATTFPRRNEV